MGVHWAGWSAVLMAEPRVASWALMSVAAKADRWVRCLAVVWALQRADYLAENLVAP